MFDLIETNRKKQLWACWDAFPTAVIILGFGVLLFQQTAISNRPPGTVRWPRKIGQLFKVYSTD